MKKLILLTALMLTSKQTFALTCKNNTYFNEMKKSVAYELIQTNEISKTNIEEIFKNLRYEELPDTFCNSPEDLRIYMQDLDYELNNQEAPAMKQRKKGLGTFIRGIIRPTPMGDAECHGGAGSGRCM